MVWGGRLEQAEGPGQASLASPLSGLLLRGSLLRALRLGRLGQLVMSSLVVCSAAARRHGAMMPSGVCAGELVVCCRSWVPQPIVFVSCCA